MHVSRDALSAVTLVHLCQKFAFPPLLRHRFSNECKDVAATFCLMIRYFTNATLEHLVGNFSADVVLLNNSYYLYDCDSSWIKG